MNRDPDHDAQPERRQRGSMERPMSNVLDDVKAMERHMRACRFEGCAETLAKAVVEIERLTATLDDIRDKLYGQGFEVSGWHLNGYQAPLDSWFEDNDWLGI